MAEMNRDEMQAVLARGESVLHRGRLIARVEDLPTESALAKGDPAREAAAREALQARRDALDAELAALAAGPAPEPTPAPKQAEAAPKDESPAESKPRGK